MEVRKPNPQFLCDESGKKTFAVLAMEEYEELLEDLHDLAIMAERKDDQGISFDEFEEGLKADRLL